VLSRTRLATLLAEESACVVAMEACATSHRWGRMVQSHGNEVRLVPATYVKPFVKRQKNDKADAEAIAEAASRPTMRFVAVTSAETQGRAVAFRTHQCLVRQRTQLTNTLRGHLAEFGLVAPKGPASLKVLETALADETSALPGTVREMGMIYLEQIARLTKVIERLADELEAASRTDAQLRRLCTIPGIGPGRVLTCHGIFPPSAIRVRPMERTDDEEGTTDGRADYRHLAGARGGREVR